MITNCYICSDLCVQTKEEINCCDDCAFKINHLDDPFFYQSSLIRTGFSGEKWKKSVELVKKDHFSNLEQNILDSNIGDRVCFKYKKTGDPVFGKIIFKDNNGIGLSVDKIDEIYLPKISAIRYYDHFSDIDKSEYYHIIDLCYYKEYITKIIFSTKDDKMQAKDFVPGTKVKCVNSNNPKCIGKLAKIVSFSPGKIKIKWEDGSEDNSVFSLTSSFELAKDTRKKINEVDPSTLKAGDYVELLIPCFHNGSEDEIINATVLNDPKPSESVVFLLDNYINSEGTESSSIYDYKESIRESYYRFKDPDFPMENNLWDVRYKDINKPGNSDCDLSHLYITKILNKNYIKEDEAMSSNELNFTQILAQDAGKAAIRSGATLGINGLKAGLQKLLANEGVDGAGAQAIMKFFEGPVGEAMLRTSLGYGLMYLPVPMIQENEYAQKLSEELRVSGMAKGMDKGVEMVQQFIVPSLLESFQGTPLLENLLSAKETKHRVSEHITSPKRVLEEIDSDETLSEKEEDFEEIKPPKVRQVKTKSLV